MNSNQKDWKKESQLKKNLAKFNQKKLMLAKRQSCYHSNRK